VTVLSDGSSDGAPRAAILLSICASDVLMAEIDGGSSGRYWLQNVS